VRDAGVVGVPDAQRGEAPIAFVVLDAPTAPEELRSFLAEQLAGYKRPREIVVVEELERLPTGKLVRRALRERALAMAAA
jgi:acyl-coenzyme A synthetase/AMP-(fatty) acid ligase